VPLAEEVMGLVVDPAALGGIAGLIALASWAIGRMHGTRARQTGLDRGEPGEASVAVGAMAAASAMAAERSCVPPAPSPTPAPASPCQQRAFEERRDLLAHPVALAELHAEASAIRRDERILDRTPDHVDMLVLSRAGLGTACRYLGLSGQPTCPGATPMACPEWRECGGLQPDAAVRPGANPC